MIDTTAIHYGTAAVYAVSAIVLTGLTLRKEKAARRYCYPFLGLIGLATVMAAAWGAGIGFVSVGSGVLRLPQLVTDYPTYVLLFGFSVYVSGAGRRYIGGVVGLLLAVRISYDLVAVFDGIIATVANLGIIAFYLVAIVLMYGPIAKKASNQPPRKELLYAKTRNLVVFIFAMLVVWSQLEVTGVLDLFTLTATLQYTNIIYRVGFAALVVQNVGALVDNDGETIPETPTSSGQVTADD
ncbi:hypothetical protein C464_02780 [Halorubrum coriense DSM 10284]|uniref:Rhodopsin n=1 Tax=Halorubrum coriense DSM 10284 TaxID=1227466 RepID=M0ES35_9EURY|nr:bacteriorhodopsin [Halorubrum coriense]ELZ50490.1 hypothetical protein C464_02780 [Halorubrum coriense DSM 10284]